MAAVDLLLAGKVIEIGVSLLRGKSFPTDMVLMRTVAR